MTDECTAVLTKARELISRQENWVQYTMAQDDRGKPCQAKSQDACRWCATGAVRRAVHDLGANEDEFSYECRMKLVRAIGENSLRELFVFNDSHSHAEVISMFDRAIEAA